MPIHVLVVDEGQASGADIRVLNFTVSPLHVVSQDYGPVIDFPLPPFGFTGNLQARTDDMSGYQSEMVSFSLTRSLLLAN